MPSKVGDIFWNNFSVYLFDADGVLWRGGHGIPHAADVINELIRRGRRVFILTNNATNPPTKVLERITGLGYVGLKQENIVTSSVVTAHYLKTHCDLSLPVYVVGVEGLKEVLEGAGVKVVGVGSDPLHNYSNDSVVRDLIIEPPKVAAVVCSFDGHLSYIKIMKAGNYLKDPNVPFIATNTDATFPGKNPNLVIPGAGVTSAAVSCVSYRQPTVMGKPTSHMYDYLRERFQVSPEQCIMIGDRLDTDIAFGNAHKLTTLLTLTGVSQVPDVERAKAAGQNHLVPTHITESLGEIYRHKPA